MDIRLPGNLQSLLSSALSRPAGGEAVSTKPAAPGQPAPSETAPLPNPEPTPSPAPEPDPNPFHGRFKIASLMPFLNGQHLFRGPFAGELGELAGRAREALDRLPEDKKADKETMRALRDELNGALDQLYAGHEPGEPIDKQAAIDTLTAAFESFVTALAGEEEQQAEGEAAEGEVSAERPRMAPRPTRDAEEVAQPAPADTDQAAPVTTGEAPEASAPAAAEEPTFHSADEVRDALGQWLAAIEERFGDQMTARDRTWSQWLSQVSGFYVRGGEDLLSELTGEAGLDDRA